MALFNDGVLSSPGDLLQQEVSAGVVARTEGISLEAKAHLAYEQIADELLDFLRREQSLAPAGGSDWELLCRVVADRRMQRWHVRKSLELLFEEAYHSQLNDRYQAKWKAYRTLATDARNQVFRLGVGTVANPIAKAARPQLARIAGLWAARVWYAAATLVGSDGTEGAPSDAVSLAVPDGSSLQINLPEARGWQWNVYAGESFETLARQNDVPLVPSASWMLPAAGFAAGAAPGEGQTAERRVAASHRWWRG